MTTFTPNEYDELYTFVKDSKPGFQPEITVYVEDKTALPETASTVHGKVGKITKDELQIETNVRMYETYTYAAETNTLESRESEDVAVTKFEVVR